MKRPLRTALVAITLSSGLLLGGCSVRGVAEATGLSLPGGPPIGDGGQRTEQSPAPAPSTQAPAPAPAKPTPTPTATKAKPTPTPTPVTNPVPPDALESGVRKRVLHDNRTGIQVKYWSDLRRDLWTTDRVKPLTISVIGNEQAVEPLNVVGVRTIVEYYSHGTWSPASGGTVSVPAIPSGTTIAPQGSCQLTVTVAALPDSVTAIRYSFSFDLAVGERGEQSFTTFNDSFTTTVQPPVVDPER